MPWHKITLNSKQVADGEQIRLSNEFEQLVRGISFVPGGPPHLNMVLFCSFRPEHHGDTDLYHHYFSPDCLPLASELIRRFGGQECPQPGNENLAFMGGLVWGDPWDLVGGWPAPHRWPHR